MPNMCAKVKSRIQQRTIENKNDFFLHLTSQQSLHNHISNIYMHCILRCSHIKHQNTEDVQCLEILSEQLRCCFAFLERT